MEGSSASYRDIYEFLTNFFIDFSTGKDTSRCLRTCRHILERKELPEVDIQSLQITERTLDFAIQNICEELFRYQYKVEYVITLLAFSIELDRCLESESWYSTERLVEALAKQLIKTDFEPTTMGGDSEFHFSRLLMNVPALFLAYCIQKWNLFN